MFLIFLLLGFTPFAGAEVVGEAFDINSNRLLYREMHCLSEDGLKRYVKYRDSKGNPVADKIINYTTGEVTPEFIQQNHLSNREISVRWRGDELKASVFSSANVQSQKLPLKKPLVIDAGFDAFIRNHWGQLLRGETLRFYFPAPTRQRIVGLRVRKTDCSYGDTQHQCFSLQLSNWLLRLLAEPIELGYDLKTKTLRRYRGLSNIEDKKGKGMVVDIHYRYDEVEGCSVAKAE